MIPIEFLRNYRLFGYAIFDFAAAFLGIYLLAPTLTKILKRIGVSIPKNDWLYLTLPIAILVHSLVGRITPLTRDFFNPQGHYILKIIIILLLLRGIKNIRLLKK